MASLVDTRPATSAGAVTALPAAVAAFVIGMGWWHPSEAELATALASWATISAILAKFVASVVYCRNSVKDLLGPPDTPTVVPTPDVHPDTAVTSAVPVSQESTPDTTPVPTPQVDTGPSLATRAVMPPGTFEAAVYSVRLGRWSTVYLRSETADEGTFVVRPESLGGLPVAEYRPDGSGTHTPLGPMEMELLGLKPPVPHVPEAP